MKPNPDVSRRTLLTTGVAGLGALGLSGNVYAESQRVEYDQRQRVAAQVNGNQPEVDLLVDWKEWYNGTVLERQDTPTSRSSAAGPLLSIADVVPGDTGRVAFGLSLDSEQGRPPPVEILMRVRETPDSRAENGLTEPERKSDEEVDGLDSGELQEYLSILVWYDTGISVSDVPLYGTCDGEFTTGDLQLAEGTLAEVSVTGEGDSYWTLDANPNNPAGSPCLSQNQGLCVGFQWTLPSSVGNAVQTDSVSFAIEFGARQCQQ